MTKRVLKTEWTDLFDPFQAGRVRDAIADLARTVEAGHALTEADALPFEKRLLAPLDAYIASQKVPGVETEKLAYVLVDICDRIRENTLCAHHADNWFSAWQAFVVGGAAHLIYDGTARRSNSGRNQKRSKGVVLAVKKILNDGGMNQSAETIWRKLMKCSKNKPMSVPGFNVYYDEGSLISKDANVATKFDSLFSKDDSGQDGSGQDGQPIKRGSFNLVVKEVKAELNKP